MCDVYLQAHAYHVKPFYGGQQLESPDSNQMCVQRQNLGRILNIAPLHHVHKHNHHRSNYSGHRFSTQFLGEGVSYNIDFTITISSLLSNGCVIDERLYNSAFYELFEIYKTPCISHLPYLIAIFVDMNTQRSFTCL